LSLAVKNGDSLAITASAYAAVVITNLGTSTVHANCGLGAIQQYKEFINSEAGSKAWKELAVRRVVEKKNE
jgi:hypothetical protein